MSRKKNSAGTFWDRVDMDAPNGCWQWTGAVASAGYGIVSWHGSRVNVHRLAWFLSKEPELVNENPKASGLFRDNNGAFIAHTCGNKLCCNPDHMRVMLTPGPAKLTSEQVREIRAQYDNGEAKITELGRRYGLHYTAVGRIVKRTSYKDV